MKIQKKLLATALVSVLALSSAVSFADHYDHKKEHDKLSQEFLDAIKATPEQRKQISEQHQQFEAQLDPIRDQLKIKKAALMKYLATPDFDKAEAIRQQEEINQLEDQKGKLYIEHVAVKQSFLKPEQKEKANAFMQEKFQKWDKEQTEAAKDDKHAKGHMED